MTKTVRIENADTSTYKVKVQMQRKDAEGAWVDDGPILNLDHPTALASIGIHDGLRAIVFEVPA